MVDLNKSNGIIFDNLLNVLLYEVLEMTRRLAKYTGDTLDRRLHVWFEHIGFSNIQTA